MWVIEQCVALRMALAHDLIVGVIVTSESQSKDNVQRQ